MFHQLLVPTDGSARSRSAIQYAVDLARACGARVHGLYVVPVPHPDFLDAFVHHDPQFAQKQRALLERLGDDYLAAVQTAARAVNVECNCSKAHGTDPASAIAHAARQLGCDVIVMASHGWDADHAQLLGSVTSKVLHASAVPVLVHKE